MRNLTADDVAGICAIYLPNGLRTLADDQTVAQDACDPTPRHGFTRECEAGTKKNCAVSVVGGPDDDGWGAGALFAGVVAAAVGTILRRRKRA
jgi:hypothetical protein